MSVFFKHNFDHYPPEPSPDQSPKHPRYPDPNKWIDACVCVHACTYIHILKLWVRNMCAILFQLRCKVASSNNMLGFTRVPGQLQHSMTHLRLQYRLRQTQMCCAATKQAHLLKNSIYTASLYIWRDMHAFMITQRVPSWGVSLWLCHVTRFLLYVCGKSTHKDCKLKHWPHENLHDFNGRALPAERRCFCLLALFVLLCFCWMARTYAH